MNENEMGYRGSKSAFTELTIVKTMSVTVKEQRVDGSCFGLKKKNFKVKVYSNGFRKILSNQQPF
jgi:hypothetical protein